MSQKRFLPQAFCSFDVETDGDNPMQYNMRSLGMVLYDEYKGLVVSTFYVTISPQTDPVTNKLLTPSKETMREFWDKHPEQWKEVNTNCLTPTEAMKQVALWFSISAKRYVIKFVAKPANFDWMFLKCYYEKYGPDDKFNIGFFCHDLTSLLRAYMQIYNITSKQDKTNFLANLSNRLPYTHNALDDARYQGEMYMRLRNLLNAPTLYEHKMHDFV